MSSDPRVSIEIVKVEFVPKKSELKVTYLVHLTTGSFEGVIGGGETLFANEAEIAAFSDLVEKVRTQIGRDLGLELSGPQNSEEEEEDIL